MARRPSSVRPSVHLSVRPSVNFCANRFFSQTNGRIATKLSQDGLQVSVHPGCVQDQGQRSRDTRTFLDSWNELLRHLRSGYYFIDYAEALCEGLRAGASSWSYIEHVDCCGLSTIVLKNLKKIIIIIPAITDSDLEI